jgi:hypothetical protein
MTEHPTEHALAWRQDQAARTDQIRRELRNAERSKRRRELYDKDPIWRLTKLKDNRERRLRAKRAADERTRPLD